MKYYVIKRKGKPEYWNSHKPGGWVSAKDAQEFTEDQLKWCPLPYQGEWTLITPSIPSIPRTA